MTFRGPSSPVCLQEQVNQEMKLLYLSQAWDGALSESKEFCSLYQRNLYHCKYIQRGNVLIAAVCELELI